MLGRHINQQFLVKVHFFPAERNGGPFIRVLIMHDKYRTLVLSTHDNDLMTLSLITHRIKDFLEASLSA